MKNNINDFPYRYNLYDKEGNYLITVGVVVESPTNILWNSRTFTITSDGKYCEGPCTVGVAWAEKVYENRK